MSVSEAVEQMRLCEFRTWLVEDEGNLLGVLNQATVENALEEGRTEEKLTSLFETLDFPHVHPDHPLHLALERMSRARFDVLPVVNRADIHKLEGIVTLRDVLDSYGVDSTGSA
jgi:CIC family chloride channel protein